MTPDIGTKCIHCGAARASHHGRGEYCMRLRGGPRVAGNDSRFTLAIHGPGAPCSACLAPRTTERICFTTGCPNYGLRRDGTTPNDASRVDSVLAVDPSRSTPNQSSVAAAPTTEGPRGMAWSVYVAWRANAYCCPSCDWPQNDLRNITSKPSAASRPGAPEGTTDPDVAFIREVVRCAYGDERVEADKERFLAIADRLTRLANRVTVEQESAWEYERQVGALTSEVARLTEERDTLRLNYATSLQSANDLTAETIARAEKAEAEVARLTEERDARSAVHLRRYMRLADALNGFPNHSADALVDEAVRRLASPAGSPTTKTESA